MKESNWTETLNMFKLTLGGGGGLNMVVIADLRISNKRAHCSTDTNVVQPQPGVGGNFSVVVYA